MRRRWVAALCTVLLAAGCGGNVEGAPVADAPVEAWDPCSIPADVIAATGLDPGSKTAGWGSGIVVDNWARCTWSGPAELPWYFFSIRYSADYLLEDAQNDPSYSLLGQVQFEGRTAIQYRTSDDIERLHCNLAVATLTGTSKISLNVMGGMEAKTDSCETLTSHARDLIALLPPTSN